MRPRLLIQHLERKKDEFLVITFAQVDDIWKAINQQQIIFHPQISPTGSISMKMLYEQREQKTVSIILDRNILVDLLTLCRDGQISNAKATQLIGLIMTWSSIAGVDISAGFALLEYAATQSDVSKVQSELALFKSIFEYYPDEIWLDLAYGDIKAIPKLQQPRPIEDININDFTEGSDDYLMIYASLLKIVQLLRSPELTSLDRIRDFMVWTCQNVLVANNTIEYAALLFTEQPDFKMPKRALSNEVDAVIAGCKNQAWDLTHLASWSKFLPGGVFYKSCNQEFLFATNDVLLKRIIINSPENGDINKLLYQLFSKKDYGKLNDVLIPIIANRNVDYSRFTSSYLSDLVKVEESNLCRLINYR